MQVRTPSLSTRREIFSFPLRQTFLSSWEPLIVPIVTVDETVTPYAARLLHLTLVRHTSDLKEMEGPDVIAFRIRSE
jgi:hypothetical protein